MTYTDNAGACPNAQKHEITGAVQTMRTAPPRASRRAASRGAASLAQQAEAAAEQSWRQKKQRSELELVQLKERREKLREAVTLCNRGGELWRRDDIGIKHTVPCKQIKNDFAGLDPRIRDLEVYLDGGLEDECRRAGCLPGWIR